MAAESLTALRQTFSAYDEVLSCVRQFKYQWRIVSYDINITPAIRRNIKKARRQWGQFRKTLEQDLVPVVASVLLYGSKSWVVSPSALRELEGFNVEAAWRLTGMRPRKVKGEWVYPHSADVLTTAHLKTIEHYIQKRRHTVYNTIWDRDVLKECEGVERRRGIPLRLFWADQYMAAPERREYGTEGEGSVPLPAARVARRRGPLSQWRKGLGKQCRRYQRRRRGHGPEPTLMTIRMDVGWVPECQRHYFLAGVSWRTSWSLVASG